MERRLLNNQYKTSPVGKDKNIKVKTTGIINIILAWVGSPVVGVSHCWANIEAPINMGEM